MPSNRFVVGKKPAPPHLEKPVVYTEAWIVKLWRCDTFDFPKHKMGAPGCSSSSCPQEGTGGAFHLTRKDAKRVFALARRLARD